MTTTSTKQTTYLDSEVKLKVPAGIEMFANKIRYSQEKTYGGHLIKLPFFFSPFKIKHILYFYFSNENTNEMITDTAMFFINCLFIRRCVGSTEIYV